MQQHQARRVIALTLLLALTGCGAVLAGVSPAAAASGRGAVPWWSLVPAFALGELISLPIRRSRPGQARLVLAATAAPLVLGLALASPVDLLIGRVLGVTLIAVALRDRPALRLGLDAALVAAGTAAAQSVVSAIMSGGGSLTTPLGAAAALLGACVAGLLDTSVLVLVAGWYEGRTPSAEAARLLLASLAGSVLAGGVALLALPWVPRGGPRLAVACCVLLAGFGAAAALAGRGRSLRGLHALSAELAETPDPSDVVRLMLAPALELIGAGYAEVTLGEAEGEAARTWVLRAGEEPQRPTAPVEPGVDTLTGGLTGPLVVRGRSAAERAFLEARGISEAVVVGLHGPGGALGHLLVGDRTAPAPVAWSDARLLETVANHATVALRNGRLIHRLHVEARQDELTGLPNRLQLRELLDRVAAEAASGGSACAVMVLDFDGFKAVNDTLGHPAGDELLRVLAGRLAAVSRGIATVARLGGDEFAVLSEHCSGEGPAQELAARLLTVFAEPVSIAGARVRLGGSLGIALGPEHGENGSDLLRSADIAMYAAKAAGGGQRTFSSDLVELTAAGLTLATELREAIDRGEISVVVQPIVELAHERLHSVEVLARWQHPELGEVSPEQFFGAAERSGQVQQLSAYILDRALALARTWADDGLRVRVAVNLAARWLADRSLPEQVGGALARHGLAADLLCLEITERGVIADPGHATATLARLRAMGVHLSVDDFGTGYSSLTYLSRLPVDQMKIDKSFVQELDGSERDRAIVRSMLDLGRNLGLEVVAEGVMTIAGRQALVDLGCSLGQGYLIARPLDPRELPAYLLELAARSEHADVEHADVEHADLEHAASVPEPRSRAGRDVVASDPV